MFKFYLWHKLPASETREQSTDRQTDRQADRYPAASCGPVCVDSADWFHTAECGTLNGQTGSHPKTLYAHESSVHTHRGRERLSKECAHVITEWILLESSYYCKKKKKFYRWEGKLNLMCKMQTRYTEVWRKPLFRVNDDKITYAHFHEGFTHFVYKVTVAVYYRACWDSLQCVHQSWHYIIVGVALVALRAYKGPVCNVCACVCEYLAAA